MAGKQRTLTTAQTSGGHQADNHTGERPVDARELPNLDGSLTGRVERQQAFVRLRAKGQSLRTIAETLNVSVGTLSSWQKDFEVVIAEHRAIELDALKEAIFLTKEQRIQQLHQQYQLLCEELEKRDLSDIDSYRLMELKLKVFQLVKEEFPPCTALE
ncbi:helix-turn-helix domain-containing protein [Thalassotalea litorea]|uniref:Helix-turn-helix domain-containing protein n=1 Tax=Thalassotalea litorea TaxID=2020715 RepID=A0A5R9IC83_9GAMM|nr:helix-turn-helix domain-containing protein [Thalassotalea litorea]TLU61211.1 helix-turn-helix domain-containing protein [Thalassotalea litorea]